MEPLWEVKRPENTVLRSAKRGSTATIIFAYTDMPGPCILSFVKSCGAASKIIEVAGAAFAFSVDVPRVRAALATDAPVPPPPRLERNECFVEGPGNPTYRSMGPAKRAKVEPVADNSCFTLPALTNLDLPIMTPQAPAASKTVMVTDFSREKPEELQGKDAEEGTDKKYAFSGDGIQMCTTMLTREGYYVYHPKNGMHRNKFVIDMKPAWQHAKLRNATCGDGEPRLAVSSKHNRLAAATLMIQRDHVCVNVKLSTVHNAYHWQDGAFTKIEGGRGTDLIMLKPNTLRIKKFESPDASPTCADAAARPKETMHFLAMVLDVVETPNYEETMVKLATKHIKDMS